MAKGIAIKEVEKSNVDEEKEDISSIYIIAGYTQLNEGCYWKKKCRVSY